MNKDYILTDLMTGKEIKVGDKVTDCCGYMGILTDVSPLGGMSGYIYMDGNRFYPSVIGCKFVKRVKLVDSIYIIVRGTEEASDCQSIEVLSSHRAFTSKEVADTTCAALIAATGLGYYVLSVILE